MNEALEYINEWHNKTDRARSDIYVPEALREAPPVVGDLVRVVGAPGFADFDATLILTAEALDERGPLAAVKYGSGAAFIVPLNCLEARS